MIIQEKLKTHYVRLKLNWTYKFFPEKRSFKSQELILSLFYNIRKVKKYMKSPVPHTGLKPAQDYIILKKGKHRIEPEFYSIRIYMVQNEMQGK